MQVNNSSSKYIANSQVVQSNANLTSKIDTGKLQNLKQKIDDVSTEVLSGAAKRQEWMFGVSGGSTKVGSTLDQIRNGSSGSANAKNPLHQSMVSNFSGGTRGHYANDTEESGKSSGGWREAVKNWLGGVVGSIFGGAGTTSGAGTVTSGPAGAVGGTAFGILTANTGSPEEKRNEAEGIIGLFRQGKKGTINSYAAELLEQAENDMEVLPDRDNGGSMSIITPEAMRGLAGKLNGTVEPTDTETSSGGGPINPNATPGGQIQMYGQPADTWGNAAHAALTSENIKAVAARIGSKIEQVKG